jgi:hypothetical protein
MSAVRRAFLLALLALAAPGQVVGEPATILGPVRPVRFSGAPRELWLRIVGDRVVEALEREIEPGPRDRRIDTTGWWILPGLVDPAVDGAAFAAEGERLTLAGVLEAQLEDPLHPLPDRATAEGVPLPARRPRAEFLPIARLVDLDAGPSLGIEGAGRWIALPPGERRKRLESQRHEGLACATAFDEAWSHGPGSWGAKDAHRPIREDWDALGSFLREVLDAGIPIQAAPPPGLAAERLGQALLAQLLVLHRAGVSPSRVLQAGLRPGSLEDEGFELRAGLAADFVLVPRDPVAELRVLLEPVAVVTQGRALDAGLLARARRVLALRDARLGYGDEEPLRLPGVELDRARFALSFDGAAAGHEDFAAAREGARLLLAARVRPRGVLVRATDLRLAFDANGRLERVHLQQPETEVFAEHWIEAGQFRSAIAEGRRLLPEVPYSTIENLAFDTPSVASAWATWTLRGLPEVGSSMPLGEFRLGWPGPGAHPANAVWLRQPDGDPGPLLVRRSKGATGGVIGRYRLDATGRLVRAELTYPFGVLVAEREP